MTYVMKDLGYKRTPTTATYEVEMPDGSLWSVPVQCIADSRDENYAEDEEDTIGSIRKGKLTEYEIADWAGNNMNWEDVSQYAVKLERPPAVVDYQEGWCNGEKEIKGEL